MNSRWILGVVAAVIGLSAGGAGCIKARSHIPSGECLDDSDCDGNLVCDEDSMCSEPAYTDTTTAAGAGGGSTSNTTSSHGETTGVGGSTSNTSTSSGGDQGNCCVPTGGAGCLDSEIQGCVCAADSFCCDTQWDSACVELASSQCGACGGTTSASSSSSSSAASSTAASSSSVASSSSSSGGGTDGDCCTSNAYTGCGVPSIQSCVCAIDSYCCNTKWDSTCASEAVTDCGASC